MTYAYKQNHPDCPQHFVLSLPCQGCPLLRGFPYPCCLGICWRSRTAEIGVILFTAAAGSLAGLLGAGFPIVARKGARLVILGSPLLIVIGFIAIGLGTALKSLPVVMGGLIIFGCGFGSAEVALNVEGSAVEKALDRTLLPAFHGFFSLGTLAGAVIGAGAVAIWHPQIMVHFSILALLMAAAVGFCYRYLPEGTGKERMDAGIFKGFELLNSS